MAKSCGTTERCLFYVLYDFYFLGNQTKIIIINHKIKLFAFLSCNSRDSNHCATWATTFNNNMTVMSL